MANTIELKQQIQQGAYDAAFVKLYGADVDVNAQRERYISVIDQFENEFGSGRSVRLYSAPGRTEIGGNHTDHNNGVVLAGSVNLDIVAVVSPNEENIIRVKSLGFEKIDDVDVTNLVPQEQEKEHSAALIRGVAAGIVNAGGKVGGFDAYTTSNVLRGSGLSSSAAFEVCIGAILRGRESVAEQMGKKVLREVDEDAFYAAIPQLRKAVGDRAVVRAIHFYNDCRRAAALCDAVRADDMDTFLKLIVEGGHSSFEFNQNAYSIKNYKEQGVPIALALSQKVLNGRGAWRLQGGGFAGTIQAFVPYDLLDTYKATIDACFGEGSCHVLNIRNYGAVPVTVDM